MSEKLLKDIQGNLIQVKPASLPAATSSTKGAIKVGSGLNITSDGTLSVQNAGNTVTVGQAAPNLYGLEYKVGDWVIDTKALYAYMCYSAARQSNIGGVVTGSSWIKIPYEKYSEQQQQQQQSGGDER